MATGRAYTIQFNGVNVTAQQDFFEIQAGSTKVLRLVELHLSQSSEIGDAQEEGLSILVKYGSGSVTTGTGGTTPSTIPLGPGDAAFSGTSKANNTTKMVVGSGTIVTAFVYNWNVRAPLDYYYPPEYQLIIAPSARFTVELATTPADAITMSGFVLVDEIA